MTTFAQTSADTNRLQIAAVEESVFATTPANPTFKILRVTGESLGLDLQTVQSSEIRADRRISDISRVGVGVSGELNFELSYGTFDDFWRSMFCSAGWSSPVTVGPSTAISFAAASGGEQVITGTGLFGSIVANQWVRVSGAASASNNGIFKVKTQSANSITVFNPNGVLASAGASITIVMGAQMIEGTTFTSFTIEKILQDLSTNHYERLLGAAVNGYQLTIPNNGLITGSFAMLGSNSGIASAALGGSTYTPATTTEVMSGVSNIVNVFFDRTTILPCTQITAEGTNNLRQRLQIGTLGAVSMGLGTGEFNGSMTVYMTNSDLTFSRFLSFTETSVAVVFRDAANNSYVLEWPAVKFTSGRRAAGGINADLLGELSFSAKLSASEGITHRIVRFAGS